MSSKFGVNGIPTFIVLDSETGNVVDDDARSTVAGCKGKIEQVIKGWESGEPIKRERAGGSTSIAGVIKIVVSAVATIGFITLYIYGAMYMMAHRVPYYGALCGKVQSYILNIPFLVPLFEFCGAANDANVLWEKDGCRMHYPQVYLCNMGILLPWTLGFALMIGFINLTVKYSRPKVE